MLISDLGSSILAVHPGTWMRRTTLATEPATNAALDEFDPVFNGSAPRPGAAL